MKTLNIAVDFDGTVVTHEFPRVGRKVTQAEEVLKELQAKGHRIILWTMRSGVHLEQAVNWFKIREIELFGVNNNPEQKSWTESPKAYAQIYIDDAALGCPLVKGEHDRPFVNWFEVRRHLVEQGILE